MPNKIASKVVSKVPVVGKPVGDFLMGKGPLGSMEKYLDPGSALVKNFTNDPENFISGLGGYSDDISKIGEAYKGIKMMFNPPDMPEAQEPPKPDAPDLSNTWREYSGWMDTAKTKRDSDISMSRARLYEAGATADVIKAQEDAMQSDYDRKVAEFQGGANFKMLQEGFDIARGARENPYAQSLAGYKEGQDLASYYSSNYAAAPAGEDPGAALIRAKQASVGGSLAPKPKTPPRAAGGEGLALAEYQAAPGSNPWMTTV
jgi:hypothetical protein